MKTARRFDLIFIDVVITPIKHVKNQTKTIVSPTVHSMKVSPASIPKGNLPLADFAVHQITAQSSTTLIRALASYCARRKVRVRFSCLYKKDISRIFAK